MISVLTLLFFRFTSQQTCATHLKRYCNDRGGAGLATLVHACAWKQRQAQRADKVPQKLSSTLV